MKLLILTIFILAGCGSVRPVQKLDPDTFYKRDICFKSSGKSYCGVGVLPESSSYNIEIDSKKKVNFFSLNNCHREIVIENKKDISVYFKPTIELGKACPIYLSSYNRNGKNSWGLIEFENREYKLSAELNCNGQELKTHGVSICQARQGTIQKISFNIETAITKAVSGATKRKEPCPDLSMSEDGKSLEFIMPKRDCIYGFLSTQGYSKHKLILIGYEDLVIRGL